MNQEYDANTSYRIETKTTRPQRVSPTTRSKKGKAAVKKYALRKAKTCCTQINKETLGGKLTRALYHGAHACDCIEQIEEFCNELASDAIALTDEQAITLLLLTSKARAKKAVTRVLDEYGIVI